MWGKYIISFFLKERVGVYSLAPDKKVHPLMVCYDQLNNTKIWNCSDNSKLKFRL